VQISETKKRTIDWNAEKVQKIVRFEDSFGQKMCHYVTKARHEIVLHFI
jgi:hypothetical protein